MAWQTCLEASAEIVLLYLNDDRVIEMRGLMRMWKRAKRERQLMIDECIVIQPTACSAAACFEQREQCKIETFPKSHKNMLYMPSFQPQIVYLLAYCRIELFYLTVVDFTNF